MTVVVDASFIGAWLIDGGRDGTWASEVLDGQDAAAPHLLPVEVTSILRHAVHHGDISDDIAALALHDLADLRVDLFPFEPFSDRVWELRDNVTAYDAWYVALAESLNAPMATVDIKLSNALGSTCSFLTPPATAA